MPIISVDANYIRYVGSIWANYQRVTAELRDTLQYRLLGVPEYLPMLGTSLTEVQMMLRRLNEEEMALAAQVRELTGWANQVDAVTGSTTYRVPQTFSQPVSTYSWSYPGVTTPYVSRYNSWYSDPTALRWLGNSIWYGRPSNISVASSWGYPAQQGGGAWSFT